MKQIKPDAILRLFWHKTRREFVPLTVMEIKRRAGGDDADVRSALNQMVRKGHLCCDTTKQPCIYETTADGQASVTAAMMGEAS
jgi:hypothetical protein